ncbi:5-azacytidine-induced protein 2 [Struthio camelus]|uniref:5-azacytidine-induced protein 2 n=1 Tax=Struthio camelus TaxID=8801 RepID=UPI00051E5B97|nr:PREDICTED: 5-azacytidine-induced protein 2 [Struthio camelus australis]XP_009686216.1 PREDICTED: 5-azacytidine-induced protein 2 [Struthio camelus australis]XP_009686217.1 PREDICTED: 5-azacytidine-induced protein 2 [Struthio camelus australis]
MEELVEDDICILNHEKADNSHKRGGEIPVSSYSGDESVASHFALVTAYEDIKKRLKETEKENSFLKKRVRILEEKLLGSRLEEECSSVGREQVNKAYQAYREACIDRDNLKSKLDKMMKETSESLKILNEQLQSKEVELLQLRTEVETQQVMKNLNSTQSSWEIEKLNSDLKVHSLEKDLEKLKKECNGLRKELQKSKQKDQAQEENPLNGDLLQNQNIQSVQQAYWELKREMSNLHLVTEMQAEVLRKLKTNSTATKKAASSAPVQCVEDLEKNLTKLHLTTSGVVYKKPSLSQNDQVLCNAIPLPLLRDVKIPSERVTLQAWTDESPIPVDGKTFQEHHSYGKSSLEDNSWVFPSPPKPNENVFWEMKNKTSLLNCPADYLDQCNQNCLHKS